MSLKIAEIYSQTPTWWAGFGLTSLYTHVFITSCKFTAVHSFIVTCLLRAACHTRIIDITILALQSCQNNITPTSQLVLIKSATNLPGACHKITSDTISSKGQNCLSYVAWWRRDNIHRSPALYMIVVKIAQQQSPNQKKWHRKRQCMTVPLTDSCDTYDRCLGLSTWCVFLCLSTPEHRLREQYINTHNHLHNHKRRHHTHIYT